MMNLKYYLRGLGIGIVVTALIMGITASRKEPLSNAEIKERAKALGMVEQSEGTLLNDFETKESPSTEPEKTDETLNPTPEADITEPDGDTVADVEDVEEKQEVSTPETPAEVLDPTPEPDVTEPEADADPTPEVLAGEETEQGEENQVSGGGMMLQIARGDGSYAVSKKLEEAGLVDSATDYDLFLYQNGYDKKIRQGVLKFRQARTVKRLQRLYAEWNKISCTKKIIMV